MCVPLKKRVLCSEKNILKKLQSAQQSQIPEGRRAHRCQMHLSCYQSWKNGNVWPVIHFRFHLLREWPGHWVHGRKMETVQREDLPKTILLSAIDNFYLVTKTAEGTSVPRHLFYISLAHQFCKHYFYWGCTVTKSIKTIRLKRNHPTWTGNFFKSQLVFLLTSTSVWPLRYTQHYKKGDRQQR